MAAFDPYHKWLGIPPEDQPANHYRLLGIKPYESDSEVISHAADQRMTHIRSFQTGQHSAVSQKILNEIASARVCLLNTEKKLEYDLLLGMESSQPVLSAACLSPIAAHPSPIEVSPLARTSEAKHKQQMPQWLPWGIGATLALLAIVSILIASANRQPAPGDKQTASQTPDAPEPETSERPQPRVAEGSWPRSVKDRAPTATGETARVHSGQMPPITSEQHKPTGPVDRAPVAQTPVSWPARENEKTLPTNLGEPFDLKPTEGSKPNKGIVAGTISWRNDDKLEMGTFKEAKGPIVFVEKQDKSRARVAMKSLLPESQEYVDSVIRTRQSRVSQILGSRKSEEAMRQEIAVAHRSIRLSARITEVIASKGRALKVKLVFEGLPEQITTRQQMTLRGDPQNFVNLRAGDLLVFEGALSVAVKPCIYCDGSAVAKCPACKGKGTVLGPARTQSRKMPDGRVVTGSAPTNVHCLSCKGKGRVHCNHPVPSKDEEWTPLERKRENGTIASVSTSKGLRYLLVELDDMLISIVPEATQEPIYFGNVPGLEKE